MSNVDMENELMQSLELFQTAIDAKENLEIICYEAKKDGSGDLLVVENSNVSPTCEGHQTTVDVSEIFAKAGDEKSAIAFVDVINNDRKPIVCEGVTRIVGYYSRTHNWNKSKIGELRDRHGKNYALSGQAPAYDESRNLAVNGLS